MGQDNFNLWAVIFAGGKTYIGALSEYGSDEGLTAENVIKSLVDGWLGLEEAYLYQSIAIPTGSGQIANQISILPFLETLFPAPIWVKPNAIQLFVEMDDADAARYKDRVEAVRNMVLKARSNLTIPEPRPAPRG